MNKLIFVLLIAIIVSCKSEKPKPRVIVLSDINNVGGDPDDKQSMAHLFMYANEVDIVGIIPDLWNGKGVEATMQCIDAYEKDFNNPDYNFQKLNYPAPDQLRGRVSKNKEEAINTIIREAKKESISPVHILIWGNMNTVKAVLYKAPEIVNNIRIYTIATHRMAENEDALINSRDTTSYGLRRNWNHQGRDEIYNDKRFDNLWWLENDWGYNGMFEGQAPRDFLTEIKEYGALGYYIWDVVQPFDWAHYFRAGDTPTLLYLLEPGIDIDNPATGSWAGKFVNPYPNERPNYWIDDAGTDNWDYAHPENTWDKTKLVYNNRVNNLLESRDKWYDAYRKKMKEIYNKE